METVRYGIVGLGNMGRDHRDNIISGKVNDVRLTAVCDLANSLPEPREGESQFTDVDKMIDKNGHRQTMLIEVKPKKQCVPPEKKSRVTRRYLREVQRWGVNKAKWDAATDYAELNGWKFIILTEDHLLK